MVTKQLENICVFIEDEKQLQEARELLERYGQDIEEDFFYISKNKRVNYLQIDTKKRWCLSDQFYLDLITLTELEKLLEDELRNKS